jgi:ubiquinone/menaquinone biosynthesis C-methylase UbiE
MVDIIDFNKQAYRSKEALKKYSNYDLYPNEQNIFDKFFRKGSSVLDLACGSGRTTVNLFRQGYQVKGTDLSDVLVAAAKEKFPEIRFETGDYSDIKEEDESYDNIFISHNGIDHAYPIQQREKVISECFRVLKKGGYLAFSSHNIKSLFFSPEYYRPRRILWMLKNTFNAFKPHVYIYDPVGSWMMYCSNDYCIESATRQGFVHQETTGYKERTGRFYIEHISVYNHFVFKKPE